MSIKLSPWIICPTENYCCMRIIEGSDPTIIANRIAFIEKTPRVRILPFLGTPGQELDEGDWRNWTQGPKGAGGPDGNDPRNELYGFYPPSREWCDKKLAEMGYILS